ncbi:MAG: hypothetical protein A3H97_01205 [Acidobacteria bacterium RIFCSPLOWO2_02_FULL_65_29]|nr:MAG: hypothetical protein A3H97_01205 [Acidobacteria bacterium RIFCSPLOWO2_02_FULL_65_29]
MEHERARKKYHPPTITRVVLRPEQAILSQCSTMGMSARDLGSPSVMTCAFGPDNCRAWAGTGRFVDSGYRPS